MEQQSNRYDNWVELVIQQECEREIFIEKTYYQWVKTIKNKSNERDKALYRIYELNMEEFGTVPKVRY